MGGFRTYGYRFRPAGSWITPGIKMLVIVCAVVFLGQTLIGLFLPPEATRWLLKNFGLVPLAFTHLFRVWQPFTYIFLHGGIGHLIINMLFLWMFGGDLERTWGTQRFYSYFFLTGVGAGLINVIVKTIADFHGTGTAAIPTIGASGAIYGILLACALLFPDRQIWLIPFPVTIPMRIFVIGAGAIEFFGTLGSSGDNVSHVTHLGGMLVGYVYLRRGSYLYGMRNRYLDWKRRRAKHKFEVYVRNHPKDPPSRPDQWLN